MIADLQDTIVALASAPGPGGRAILRLSGPRAYQAVESWFTTSHPIDPCRRGLHAGELTIAGIAAKLPADLYVFAEPRSYTGQLLVELHTLSSPPLVEMLIAQCLNGGARAALPGEFTLRAFLTGKLDLPKAEAIFGTIAARDRRELQHALTQLAGGLSDPLRSLRSDLLDLLADLEAGLDFADEDISFIDTKILLDRLTKGLAVLTVLERQMQQRALQHRPFRVVLAGRPNAGKSSLFNALLGIDAALVSDTPGTTRDYLAKTIEVDGVAIELIDTAGHRHTLDELESAAQSLGQGQWQEADLIAWCEPVGEPGSAPADVEIIVTKCDLAGNGPIERATSAAHGTGILELKSWLAEKARQHGGSPMAPSWSRCRHHVQRGLTHLRQAHAHVLYEDPPEVLAMELRNAIDQIGEMVGAVYTDDLLDRIFSRFCIGK